MLHALPRVAVDLGAQELDIRADLLRGLTRVLDFKPRHFGSEILIEAEVKSERQVVKTETSTRQPASLRLVEVAILALAQVPVQSVSVFVHLFLALDVGEALGRFPPLGRSLHDHSVGFDLFDQFLGSRRQQGRLIARANEVHILAIKAFGQVKQSRGEARFSKQIK